jgi:hypothetical protein
MTLLLRRYLVLALPYRYVSLYSAGPETFGNISAIIFDYSEYTLGRYDMPSRDPTPRYCIIHRKSLRASNSPV